MSDYTFTPFHRGGSGPPLLLIHGFTDTWRTWELVLPMLERHHEVLAVTLAGHAGGPPVGDDVSDEVIADALERALDDAGFDLPHVAGNSLGGYVALKLAERGRARSVVALAPGGGTADGDDSYLVTLAYFERMHELVRRAAPHADAIAATPEGRRRATQEIAVDYEHIPADLVAHLIRGAAACSVAPMVRRAREHGWPLDPERVTCTLRIVWGTEDRILPWPRAAARYRAWFPQADWIELDGVGHCPQLDAPAATADLILGLTSNGIVQPSSHQGVTR